jgi:hypothetical protein
MECHSALHPAMLRGGKISSAWGGDTALRHADTADDNVFADDAVEGDVWEIARRSLDLQR